MVPFRISFNQYKNISLISNIEVTNTDCTIRINNYYTIDLPLICAITTSSIIADLIHSDPTLRNFSFDIPFKEKPSDSILQKIDLALNLNEVALKNDEEILDFAHVGKCIGNSDFIVPFINRIEELDNKIYDSIVFDNIAKKLFFNLSIEHLTNEIDFLAKNFDRHKDTLLSLSSDESYTSIIELVIRNPNLLLIDEDPLLNFVISIC